MYTVITVIDPQDFSVLWQIKVACKDEAQHLSRRRDILRGDSVGIEIGHSEGMFIPKELLHVGLVRVELNTGEVQATPAGEGTPAVCELLQ